MEETDIFRLDSLRPIGIHLRRKKPRSKRLSGDYDTLAHQSKLFYANEDEGDMLLSESADNR